MKFRAKAVQPQTLLEWIANNPERVDAWLGM